MRLAPAILIASALVAHAADLTAPSEVDRFLYIAAINFKSGEFCRRIDPSAVGRTSPLGRPGHQIQDLRSECYREIATALRDGSLCEHVKPVSANGLDGSRFDKADCLSRLNGAAVLASPDPFFLPVFVRLLQKIGYDDGVIASFVHRRSPYNNPTHSSYQQLRAKQDFLERVRSGPSYSEARAVNRIRTARPAEYLYEMIAIDNNEPKLCAKVSPNATFTRHSGRKALLRSECYRAIAANQRNGGLCDYLPRSGTFPFVQDSFDSLESCRRDVAIYSRPGFNDGGLRHGPTVFPDPGDFGRALREIGFGGDQAGAVAPKPTADNYWEFFSHLSVWGSPQDRAEFLRRVGTLR